MMILFTIIAWQEALFPDEEENDVEKTLMFKTHMENLVALLDVLIWHGILWWFSRIVNEVSNWKSVEVWILIAKKNRKVAASFLGSTFQNDLGCITQCFKINKIVSISYFLSIVFFVCLNFRAKKYKIF